VYGDVVDAPSRGVRCGLAVTHETRRPGPLDVLHRTSSFRGHDVTKRGIVGSSGAICDCEIETCGIGCEE